MSADSVSTSMILPLPSSPHWAPTRIVFAIDFLQATPAGANKNPRTKSGAKRRGLCVKKLEMPHDHVNSTNDHLAEEQRPRSAGSDNVSQSKNFGLHIRRKAVLAGLFAKSLHLCQSPHGTNNQIIAVKEKLGTKRHLPLHTCDENAPITFGCNQRSNRNGPARG